MSFSDWLTKLPENEQIEVNSSPLVLNLVRKAYTAGMIEKGIQENNRRHDDQLREALIRGTRR